MSNSMPIVPLPDDADGESLETATTEAEDGTRKLDLDANDSLIDGADADRIAAQSGEADPEDASGG